MDETYIRVKGQWYYLYRAVDQSGQTIDFLLTEHRDTEAALRFLTQAIRRHGVPKTITIDGTEANEAAIHRYNETHGTHIIIRQVKYLNNVIEQDHRAVKRVTRPMLGFKALDAAQATLAGIELMHMLKKRQLVVEEGDEAFTPAEQFYALAAQSLHRQGQPPLHDLLSKICNTTTLPTETPPTPRPRVSPSHGPTIPELARSHGNCGSIKGPIPMGGYTS
jgi:hypothetical protein